MRRLLNIVVMLAALALAGIGGLLLAMGIYGHKPEFTVSLGIFLLAASQLGPAEYPDFVSPFRLASTVTSCRVTQASRGTFVTVPRSRQSRSLQT